MTNQLTATYGHGTENDFVILFDADDQIEIKADHVAAICNRATGIGADGFIRIVKRNAKWFMDYRNADGIRVMARYLVEKGHQPEGIFAIDTRDGMKHLRVPMTGDISVNMGKVTDEMEEVSVLQNAHTWDALNISVGNPHAVTFVEDLSEVGSLESAPIVTPPSSYPEGVNVEFVQILPNQEARMRVHERGSGETRSCGTGTCAVALAATIHSGGTLPSRWTIYPPGGRLIVDIDGHSNATLIGPAELVREVEIGQYLTA
jgi:diaminopimelate epimerase